MKKITLLTILCLTINLSFSQVLFEDDFDGSGPGLTGWTVIDVDGNTVHPNVAQFTSAWIEADDPDNTGDVVAQSTSWYQPAGTSDDWLITPAISLTGDSTLTWDEEAQDADYPDGYEVLVSTTGNTVADFTNPPEFSIGAASGASWITRSVDLSAYNGQTVYIAWRNNSTDQFILMINNVLVEIPNSFDVSITASTEAQEQYTRIPVDQTSPIGTGATIDNIGTDQVTNAIASITVTNDMGATVYTESSSAFTIASGASQPVTFTGYTPTDADIYTTTYSVAIAETDGNSTNNSVAKSTDVTAGTYARDDNTPAGVLGIGADNGGYLGQSYDVINTQDLVSVTFAIGNATGVLTDLQVRATIWDMPLGVPNTQIATTDFATVTAIENDVYTVNITGGALTLAPGQYLVAIEEPDLDGGMPTGENVQAVTTAAIFTTGTTWVNWPTNPNGAWSNNEDFDFSVSYFIRPNFQQILSVDEFGLNDITVELYPNPARNYVTIANPNQIELQSASIIDITGRVLKTYDLSGTIDSERTIDISNLNAANYFMTIQSNHGSITKQLIVK